MEIVIEKNVPMEVCDRWGVLAERMNIGDSFVCTERERKNLSSWQSRHQTPYVFRASSKGVDAGHVRVWRVK